MPSVDPVNRPTVKLGEKEYPLKFRLSDVSRLNKEYQIDLFTPEQVAGVKAMERIAAILSVGIAHTGEVLTPEQVAEHIDITDLPIYALAIVEAQKKVSAESLKATEALTAMTQASKSPKVVQ